MYVRKQINVSSFVKVRLVNANCVEIMYDRVDMTTQEGEDETQFCEVSVERIFAHETTAQICARVIDGTRRRYTNDGLTPPSADDIELDGYDAPDYEASPKSVIIPATSTEAEDVQTIYEPNTLEGAKALKLAELKEFDNKEAVFPDGVNCYCLNGIWDWIKEGNRMGLYAQMDIVERNGGNAITLLVGDVPITVPTSNARALLDILQSYAYEACIVTKMHMANIAALTTIEQVQAYDFKTGYPAQPVMTIEL